MWMCMGREDIEANKKSIFTESVQFLLHPSVNRHHTEYSIVGKSQKQEVDKTCPHL